MDTERALTEMRRAADILTEALNAEHVAPDLASRIINRFLFGDPRGLDEGPMPVAAAFEVTFPDDFTPEQRQAWWRAYNEMNSDRPPAVGLWPEALPSALTDPDPNGTPS